MFAGKTDPRKASFGIANRIMVRGGVNGRNLGLSDGEHAPEINGGDEVSLVLDMIVVVDEAKVSLVSLDLILPIKYGVW